MHKDRALWFALGGLAVACAAFALYQLGPHDRRWLPGCTFHQLTGLNCPGCGMTRAAYATLHGRLGEAFLEVAGEEGLEHVGDAAFDGFVHCSLLWGSMPGG